MRISLISTYELGHQPFGLASPAAWLQELGVEVTCLDLAIQPFSPTDPAIAQADLIAFYLPMHTATRLAIPLIRRIKRLNPAAHLCAYGLYAPVNEAYLRQLGVASILGGEFEQGLVALAAGLSTENLPDHPAISLARQQFRVPDRTELPALGNYAHLTVAGETRTVGYTEASRGCKHLCRHCPIVPVYNGRFRIIQPDIVLADIRQQVAAGAQHITFGDPDFFNGPTHALRIMHGLYAEFPDLTYDVIIKVEHLLKHADLLPVLRDTGCLFVTSAVEAVDEQILTIFDKGHTQSDFAKAVQLLQNVGLTLNPTFVSFTPWTTVAGYAKFLATIANLGLVDYVTPIQYAIRLLIPAGSKLLTQDDIWEGIDLRPFDPNALIYPWSHPDPRMDKLYEDVFRLVKVNERSGESRRIHFERVWQTAVCLLPPDQIPPIQMPPLEVEHIPTISESWY
ncbi:Radical SAM domain protein [hydrothermal vent metagenome]|uniref:Radical SAM domain protein n=1 Tax=hydrothermal vent metagenome TaxID=652676 RepID=A0A3B0UZ62_9ZZZZ